MLLPLHQSATYLTAGSDRGAPTPIERCEARDGVRVGIRFMAESCDGNTHIFHAPPSERTPSVK